MDITHEATFTNFVKDAGERLRSAVRAVRRVEWTTLECVTVPLCNLVGEEQRETYV